MVIGVDSLDDAHRANRADWGSGRPRIWLALSGGGFRAVLFQYGCLKRLHELGLLGFVTFLSATSGGALTAALFGSRSQDLEWTGKYIVRRYDWERFEKDLLDAAIRGVLGPTTLLVIAYATYATALVAFLLLPLLGWLPPLTLGVLAVGLHCAVAWRLRRLGAHRPTAFERKPQLGAPWEPQVSRFWSMLWRPSQTRWQTLRLALFEGHTMLSISPSQIQIYITTVDLLSGLEVVFSNTTAASLDYIGCQALWKGYLSDGFGRYGFQTTNVAGVGLGLVVSASSAYPPYFRPVRITVRRRPIGFFVDGGIVDNGALNVPIRLAETIRPPKYDLSKPYGFPSFRQAVSHVLALDAAADIPFSSAGWWPRSRSILRLLSVLQNRQEQVALESVARLEALHGIPSWVFGLRVGSPSWCEIHDDRLHRAARRIRTHFDAFTPIECATLAYLGYCWIDYWARDWEMIRTWGRIEAPLRGISEILPERFGPVPSSIPRLLEHLAYSHRRLRILRWLGRVFRI